MAETVIGLVTGVEHATYTNLTKTIHSLSFNFRGSDDRFICGVRCPDPALEVQPGDVMGLVLIPYDSESGDTYDLHRIFLWERAGHSLL